MLINTYVTYYLVISIQTLHTIYLIQQTCFWYLEPGIILDAEDLSVNR